MKKLLISLLTGVILIGSTPVQANAIEEIVNWYLTK